MSICQNCGTHFISSALCTTCRPAMPAAPAPLEYATPQKLPLVWTEKFALIDRAGGVGLPKLTQLPLAARLRIHCNLFAMLFGVLYYVCKGMWKRGVSLALLAIALTLLLQWSAAPLGLSADTAHNLATALSALAYAWRANVDYYKQAVLGDDSWW
ncbi:uncharacterized protein DUF2628 [Pseudoduganella flava]|uniref:DUF2628 domain-containing protein n=1 Tax=Pseudoduganella flava TaxID=871742 RepID=A0A562Q3E7_9BURK|nr:DUF2628 domain-containing protein [Pseudoduganella flava]QGZ41301.1 DUF2628 domain-containing protein [Pseudoduganella flava]TWI51242.1 uncharacterized protein DUF2628 [Pseudoduganella flava]